MADPQETPTGKFQASADDGGNVFETPDGRRYGVVPAEQKDLSGLVGQDIPIVVDGAGELLAAYEAGDETAAPYMVFLYDNLSNEG